MKIIPIAISLALLILSCKEEIKFGSKVSTAKCGDEEYNPKTQFCGCGKYDANDCFMVYDKCGGKEYNPLAEVCSNGKLYPGCAGKIYNPLKEEYCCCGTIYDGTKNFCQCSDGSGCSCSIKELCGGKASYELYYQFCYKGNVYEKCGSEEYNPEMQFCYKDENGNGDIYKTVKIGEQIWMAENLNYAAKGSRCYDEKLANCNKYGRLYNFATAMRVCARGWHLPSDAELEELFYYINNGDNNFAVLYGGRGSSDGNFSGAGYEGNWWSATEVDAGSAYIRHIRKDGEYENPLVNNKSNLYSVRCVRD